MNARNCLLKCAAGMLTVVTSCPAWAAMMINVPDASFEAPVAGAAPFYLAIPNDNGSTTGAWQGYGGFRAVVKSGGPNGYNVSPTGIDGSQFADQSSVRGTGVFQDLAPYDGSGAAELYWQPGTYTLTAGVFSRGDNPVGANNQLGLKLFYRAGGTRTGNPFAGTLGVTNILGNEVTTTSLTDFSVTVSLSPGDAAIGLPIGIWFQSLEGADPARDWGYDNVRLEFTPVPEPSTLAVSCALLAIMAVWRPRTSPPAEAIAD
jgi:hypothetical protein